MKNNCWITRFRPANINNALCVIVDKIYMISTSVENGQVYEEHKIELQKLMP